MKRIYLFAAVTAIALAACTKTETTGVSEGNLIKFDNAFVGNVTKGDVSGTNLSAFWVYGQYENSGNYVTVFNNTKVSGGPADGSSTWTPEEIAYWIDGKSYVFAAYSDGNNKLDAGVSFTPGEKKLSISNYTVGENDLVAATTTADKVTASSQTSVRLSFKHLLSKVRFTFTTSMADSYTMAVEGLTFNAVKTSCSVDFTDNQVGNWSGTAADYSYDSISDFASGTEAFVEEYVIPQSNENLVASFTVIVSDAAGEIDRKNFSDISLAYSGSESGTTQNTWTPGFAYNYTAEINLDDITDDAKPITFTVTSVPDFNPATDTPLTIE